MIKTRRELKDWIKYERGRYCLTYIDYITGNQLVSNWKYVRLLRYCEYFRNKKTRLAKIPFLIMRIRKNNLGKKLGIEIYENCVEKGLLIWHSGCIVINGKARIGENFVMHGSNCIGNNGRTENVPSIGNNIEMGFGSSIIGNVKLVDNITIGANSTVVKDCKINGAVLVGSPAREVK